MAAERGFLYISANDGSHFEECVRSATQLCRLMPDIPIALVSDEDTDHNVFDTVIVRELQGGFSDKPTFVRETPFEKTIFLDTDTFVTTNIEELFDILDEYSMAAAHAPARQTNDVDLPVPTYFPEFNTGVLVYRNSTKMNSFFQKWKSNYSELRRKQVIGDQISFRSTAFNSDVSIHTLPPEYNTRTHLPGFVKGEAKILHGRNPDMNIVAEKLNEYKDMRVYVPAGNYSTTLNVYSIDRLPTTLKLRGAVNEFGVLGAIKKGALYVFREKF